MGEAKRKSEIEPIVSVLIPSRGRPDLLARCVASLVATAGGANIEIIVGLDDDDPTIGDVNIEAAITTVVAPRHRTLGALINDLAVKAHGRWLFALGDDYVMTTAGWPKIIATAGDVLPRRVGVLYPKDAAHPGFASHPIVSREVFKELGYYHTPIFPFWFADTWWDEIGTMLDLKVEIPIEIAMPDARGATTSLRDLPYWVEIFVSLRSERLRDAVKLLKLAYDDNDSAVVRFAQEIPQRQYLCVERVKHLRNPRKAEELSVIYGSGGAPSAHYAEVKAEALQLVRAAEGARGLRVAVCVPSGRTWEAATAIDVIAMCTVGAQHGINIMPCNMQTSMISMGRNQSVEIALENGADYLMWVDSDIKLPPDSLLRLLSHKKDIVGATYNKRVPPYETLGKLAKLDPDQLRGGLHEAVLLPGGVVLVKADVYRKIGWPYYFECYKWPGRDGLDLFKGMMRDYFKDEPPEDVLASIDDTPFGRWMRDGYQMGEFGENFLYWSEDNAFCRKARKHGYSLWCDLDLTYQVVHLGTLEVTCKPDPAQMEELIAREKAFQDAEVARGEAPGTGDRAEAAD